MSNKEWEHFGEEVKKTVQSAVQNQDYEKLNQTISETVNQAVNTLSKELKNSADALQTKYHGYKTYTTDFWRSKNTAAVQRPISTLIKKPSKILTILAVCLGFFCAIFLSSTVIEFLIMAFQSVRLEEISQNIMNVFVSCAMTAGFLWLGVSSVKKISRIDRFRKYITKIGQKEYCEITDLMAAVGSTKKEVVKDLQYMIRKQWFLEGHLDRKRTCLIITNQMYEQYRALEKQKELEQKEEKSKMDHKTARSKLPAEVRKVLTQGDIYLKKIRACNDAIPGEEISAKIDRIEMLADKIFDRVEQEPKSVSDIQKLMDYYLPTTVKLLEAYAELDAQPSGGENILAAKKEIETTLDTLNVAFDKLLDSLFQETAWDVSSDISVLNTMLAQEGLKEDGLKANK